jgi:GST-like protein
LIKLYTSPTPNGWKATITLEELQIPYELNVIDFIKKEQHTPMFLALNPNGRIPVILDTESNTTIFESGALMLYLAEKAGALMPKDPQGYWAAMQWLMFQMGGIGPMQGQAVSFERYFSEDVPAARKRYKNETRRLYEVLNKRLADVEYLAGEYSIADIANWAWVKTHRWARIPVDGLEHLQRWIDVIAKRPAVIKGIEVPPPTGRSDKQQAMGASMTTS